MVTAIALFAVCLRRTEPPSRLHQPEHRLNAHRSFQAQRQTRQDHARAARRGFTLRSPTLLRFVHDLLRAITTVVTARHRRDAKRRAIQVEARLFGATFSALDGVPDSSVTRIYERQTIRPRWPRSSSIGLLGHRRLGRQRAGQGFGPALEGQRFDVGNRTFGRRVVPT